MRGGLLVLAVDTQREESVRGPSLVRPGGDLGATRVGSLLFAWVLALRLVPEKPKRLVAVFSPAIEIRRI